MYCFLNNPVKSSMLPRRCRRRPVCPMLIVNILEHRGCCESLSAVDGVLRCCRSAGTVQTGMAVPCHADTCRPKCRVWIWCARGCRADVRRYDECLSAHSQTCECLIQLAPLHSLPVVGAKALMVLIVLLCTFLSVVWSVRIMFFVE